MVVRPGSTLLSGSEVRFLASGPVARRFDSSCHGVSAWHAVGPRRQPVDASAAADAAADAAAVAACRIPARPAIGSPPSSHCGGSRAEPSPLAVPLAACALPVTLDPEMPDEPVDGDVLPIF